MNFKLKIFSLLSFCFFYANTFAQKVLADGILNYTISIESTNGEKQVGGSLNGAALTVYLTKDRSRTEMESAAGSETFIYDSRAGKGIILKEYSGQKLMITTSAENWSQKNQVKNNLNFSIDNSIINIGGYNCNKGTAVSSEGKTYTVYFDPSTVVSNKTYNNAFPQLPGLPVQYELKSGNLVFKYTLNKYAAETISPAKFEAPKAGYRIMTYEENQQLKKGD